MFVKNVFVLVCARGVDKEGREEGTRTKQKKGPLWILIFLHLCSLQLSPCPVGIPFCSGHNISFSGYSLRFTLSSSPTNSEVLFFIFLSFFSLSSFKTKNNQMGVFQLSHNLNELLYFLKMFSLLSFLFCRSKVDFLVLS